jgi:hypothetical protein
MNTKQALRIVTQVVEWRNRKGSWPKPNNQTELELIVEAFRLIKAKV